MGRLFKAFLRGKEGHLKCLKRKGREASLRGLFVFNRCLPFRLSQRPTWASLR